MKGRFVLRLPPVSGIAGALVAFAGLAVVPAGAARAQDTTAAVARAGASDTSAFRRLELPRAGTIRTGAGAPGRDYWQQRADYVIRASLDAGRNVLTGDEQITYTNNSPDTLRYVWLQLDQNLFSDSSRGAKLFPPDSRSGTAHANGGVTLKWVAVGRAAGGKVAGGTTAGAARGVRPAASSPAAVPPAATSPARFFVNGTLMRVDLPRPLAPGGRIALSIGWTFPFGSNANRMGIEEVDGATVYEVAQWYPRMAVYDDVRGWNTEQYLGQGEFYLEYGKFDVSLTVPAEMLVAATGTLRNPERVLTPVQRARLARAATSDSTVIIRGRDEIADPASRPVAPGGTLTWRFTADSVRDFAWAAAKHFIWDAARANRAAGEVAAGNGGRTLAQSFYPPSADSIWNQSTQYVKFAVENYSRWLAYPYAVATNVNGIEGGMEYPMIVFCHNRTGPEALFGVTDHEIGHSWFPMIVGNNERLYPWMDEGFNTFQNYYNWEKKFPGRPNRRANAEAYLRYATAGEWQPVMIPADRIEPQWLGQIGYNKPGLALRLLRDVVLGPERFDGAMREYVRRWAYKHPTPADFFRTIEDATGEDLSWFWRPWFYTTATLDQSVDSIAVADTAGQVTSKVWLRNRGGIIMPVDLELRFDDGATERLTLPAEIWFAGATYGAVVPGKRVTGATVDPDSRLPDVHRDNNRFPATPGEREPLSGKQ
jgi:hypothetical protein